MSMEQIEVGRKVKVPVHVSKGPFPDQLLAMIRFEGRNVSGLLDRAEVIEVAGSAGFVKGEVVEVKGEMVTLAVPKALSGGYFTRSGRAKVPLAWARANLLPLDAA